MSYQIGKTLSLDNISSIFTGLIHSPVLYGEKLSAECGRAMTEVIRLTSSAVAYKDENGKSTYESSVDYISRVRRGEDINKDTAWGVVGKVGSTDIKAFDILVNKNHAMMVTHVYDDGTYDIYDYAGGIGYKVNGKNDIDLSKGYRAEVNGEEYYFPYLGTRTINRSKTGTWVFDKDKNISFANSFSTVNQDYIDEFEYVVRFQGETDFSQDAGDKLVSLMKDEQLKTRKDYKIENKRKATFVSMTDAEAFYADERDKFESTIGKPGQFDPAMRANSFTDKGLSERRMKVIIEHKREEQKYYWGGSW